MERDQRTTGKETTVCEAPIQFILLTCIQAKDKIEDTGLSLFQINW